MLNSCQGPLCKQFALTLPMLTDDFDFKGDIDLFAAGCKLLSKLSANFLSPSGVHKTHTKKHAASQ